MKQNIFLFLFFGAFILVGLGLVGYGFARLAIYRLAEPTEATVLSAEYDAKGAIVSFSIERDGKEAIVRARLTDNIYEQGRERYYEGKQVVIRVDGQNRLGQFGKTEIAVLAGGGAFTVAGALFLYFFVGKRRTLPDIAYEYESATVPPQEVSDATAQNEAVADELSRLSQHSLARMSGEAGVWRRRIAARFRTYSVWENVIYGSLLVVPIILLSVYPLFFGKAVTLGRVFWSALEWLFAYCFLGVILKTVVSVYFKILVKCGKFCEKREAKVLCAAFESSGEYSSGEFSRTHTVFKKFRVVAQIDGKRSIGFVKGNLPPAEGTVLKVLIRPNRPKRWIVDVQ